jgi:hypothetical protein
MYRFSPKRITFRNGYCLACAQPRRSVQIRSFDAYHIFWIPFLPLGFYKRWICTACNRPPHVHPGTRRAFKWAGLAVLLIFAAGAWSAQFTPDDLAFGWVMRIGAPIGAVLTFIRLLRTPKDPSLQENSPRFLLPPTRSALSAAPPSCSSLPKPPALPAASSAPDSGRAPLVTDDFILLRATSLCGNYKSRPHIVRGQPPIPNMLWSRHAETEYPHRLGYPHLFPNQ